MSYVCDPQYFIDIGKDIFDAMVGSLTVEQKLAGLKPEDILSRFSPEERLVGLKAGDILGQFSPEERLVGLKPEDIEAYLKKLKQ